MNATVLSPQALQYALHLRDLTDPRQGAHAMQSIIEAIVTALRRHWRCPCQLHRASPVVSVQDNYDQLGYPAGGAARDARYTRYITSQVLLRTQTSAMIPGLLRAVSIDPPRDLLLACPGLVYRRDCIDRLHTGEPHQLDLWRITRNRLDKRDLHQMIATVVQAALPDYEYRVTPAEHPYTTGGLQIDVKANGQWVEIGECGMASPKVLAYGGLDSDKITGLAMGLGLDRLLMIRKGIGDIRLLRAEDPRVEKQMLDLAPYQRVSNQPAIRRDLSLAVDQNQSPEELGDRIRETMGEHANLLESVEVVGETPYESLPPAAHRRMGMRQEHKNVLLRLVIRHPVRTLTHAEANEVRDQVYRAVHEGDRWELAST
jgi:phenylalanyl-tRNA synthetase alpha chain